MATSPLRRKKTMTDNVIPFPTQNKDAREAYHVIFLYDLPMPSTMTVAAKSAEHAKELALLELKNHRNVEIMDVYRLKDAPELERMMDEFMLDHAIPSQTDPEKAN